MASTKKIQSIFKLMEILVEKKTIKASDEKIATEMGYCTKTLDRHLKELEHVSSNIIRVKKGYNNIYELIEVSSIFEKIMKKNDNLHWLFELVERFDRGFLKDINYKTPQQEKDIFLYKNFLFEELQSERQKEIFSILKEAIKTEQYLDIDYVYNEQRVHKKAIALKLIFMEYHWYVAIVDKEIGIRFLRVFFIQKVKQSLKTSHLDAISNNEMNSYHEFLKTFQNPMSRYDKLPQVVTLKASPKVAKYFKPHMKRHFSSEKFIENCVDGSVIFSVEYSQSIEILPFIKKWLPDLKILSPQSLEEKLRMDLKTYLGDT